MALLPRPFRLVPLWCSDKKDDPSRPLILHTLPADTDAGPSTNGSTSNNGSGKENSNNTLHPSTLAIPRLISVVEKIKREYLSSLTPGPEKRGLWQYTETGLVGGVEMERPSLERVLSGKTK